MKRHGLLILLFLLLSLSSPLLASWQTYETEHFFIHYQEDLSSLIPRVALMAEEVHRELIVYYYDVELHKTHLILMDSSDFAGGYADPHLIDQIVIQVSPPLFREFGTSYDDWIRLALAHEYAHILHLNLREGTLKEVREVLGKIPGVTTPNQFLPWWMLEGYAIMAETELTPGGRGEDSFYDMYMRTAFLEGDVYSFDQIHGKYPLDRWPTGGLSVYLYGASLFQYLSTEYGMERLIEVSRRFSSRPTAGINGAFLEVYGKSGEELFLQWKEAKEEEYQKIKEQILREGITRVEQLTYHGYYTYSPLLHSIEESIYYYHTGHHFPGLREFCLSTGEDRALLKGVFSPTSISLTHDGEGILYARADYVNRENLYFDLYDYHLETEKETQLTSGERARDGVMTPCGQLLYVVQKRGESEVVLRDDEGRRSLFPSVEGYQYSDLTLSPSGEDLAFILWRPGGFQDLYLYSFKREVLVPVTSNQITIDDPSWSPDGTYILFSADKGGIYNLYAYHVREDTFYQITNLLTGAFDPLVYREEILFVGYGPHGFDLYKMPYEPEEWKRVSFPFEVPSPPKDSVIHVTPTSYNPFLYLSPQYLVPNFYFSTQGNYLSFVTGGRDPLDTIEYSLSLEYEGLGPIYYDLTTQIERGLLRLSHRSSRQKGRESHRYIDTHSLRLSYPLSRSLFHVLSLGTGVQYRSWLDHSREGGEDYQGHIFLNRASVTGRDTWTRNQDLLLQYNMDYIGEEFYGTILFDWRETISFSRRETLSLRGAFGYGERENSLAIGGLYGYFPMRGYRDYSLGHTLYYFMGEYREVVHPLKEGQGLNPIFFDNISAAIFIEGGLLHKGDSETFFMGYGGELSLRMEFFYGLMPSRLNIGLAGNIHDDRMRLYFSFGYPY